MTHDETVEYLTDQRQVVMRGDTLPEAYHKALLYLEDNDNIAACNDWGTLTKECAMTLFVRQPLLEPMISKFTICGPKELEQYRQEMLDGILDFEVGHNWPYTYHERYADQYPAVIQELKRNPSTRRACMVIRRPNDILMLDPPCLQHIQFMIRNDKLNMYVLFRSNDAVKATFMNAFALIMLQKKVAVELGVEVGTYTHTANSFHAYKKDWPTLKAYAERIRRDNLSECTYNYEDDWEDQMKEAQPEIWKTVQAQKAKHGLAE